MSKFTRIFFRAISSGAGKVRIPVRSRSRLIAGLAAATLTVSGAEAAPSRRENCATIARSYDTMIQALSTFRDLANSTKNVPPVDVNDSGTADRAVAPFVRAETSRKAFVASADAYGASLREIQALYEDCSTKWPENP